jgi:hypothetical protein
MDALQIDLIWYTDKEGYQIENCGKDENGLDVLSIVGRSGQLVETRPFDRNELVFKAFESMAKSPEGLLKFVNVYGLLDAPAYDLAIPNAGGTRTHYSAETVREEPDGRFQTVRSIKGENVADHLKTAKVFRDVLQQSGPGWKNIPRRLEKELYERLFDESLGEVRLTGDRKRGFRLVLTANSLMHGMWLQLARKIAGGAGFRICELCGGPFEVGPNTGRRADSKFCSDKHRRESNSRKRSQSL